jgi:hypothetical protein
MREFENQNLWETNSLQNELIQNRSMSAMLINSVCPEQHSSQVSIFPIVCGNHIEALLCWGFQPREFQFSKA